MNVTGTNHRPSRFLAGLAFAVIYVIWGSTYLAIRIVVESAPPFLSAGARFLIAGALLFWLMRLKGRPFPSVAQWKHAAVTGSLLLLGGNGLVVWAEQSIASGRAALLVALAPVWFAVLEWLRPGGKRPEPKAIAGILIGLGGVVVLVAGRSGNSGHNSLAGTFAVVFAGISWAAGSLYNRHSPNTASPWMSAASQMICGGGALLLASLFAGEPMVRAWEEMTPSSLLALLYLIVFGSWIGFSAYVWLLKVSTPEKVSTYAYVNPVIAVFLGWALLGEVVTRQTLWGALVILVGVVVITVPQSFLTGVFRRGAGAPLAVEKRQLAAVNARSELRPDSAT